MVFLLSVYGKNRMKEFLLPSKSNLDYEICLRKTYFQLTDSLHLKLQNLDKLWYFTKTSQYQIYESGRMVLSEKLCGDCNYEIVTKEKNRLTIISTCLKQIIIPYQKYRLKGAICIGRDEKNDIVVNQNELISRVHVQIEKREEDWFVENKSINGMYVNGVFIMEDKKLEFGDYINVVGLQLVFLEEYIAVNDVKNNFEIESEFLEEVSLSEYMDFHAAIIHKGEKAGVYGEKCGKREKFIFHRAPRNMETIYEGCFEIEEPPAIQKEKQESLLFTVGPMFTFTLPMIMGSLFMITVMSKEQEHVGMYVYSGLVMTVSSVFLNLIWTIGSYRNKKWQLKKEKEEREGCYLRYLEEKSEEIEKQYDHNKFVLENRYISAYHCSNFDGKQSGLWNRNTYHSDFLKFRIGLGELFFQAEVRLPKEKFQFREDEMQRYMRKVGNHFNVLYQVPILIDLESEKQVGFVGEKEEDLLQLAKILITQIAANNCYTEVKIAAVYDKEKAENQKMWNSIRWLPHVWSGDRKYRYIASDREEASDLFYKFMGVIRERVGREDVVYERSRKERIHYILFISAIDFLEGEPILKYITKPEENYEISIVWIASTKEELPNSCNFIVENNGNFQGYYHVIQKDQKKKEIAFDNIPERLLDKFARRLSNIEVPSVEENKEIPERVSLFEMYHITEMADLPIIEYWKKNKTYENIRGLIGEKTGGLPCYLDVHEKYHGPHGLIAGTTGSGKSEMLQTYILSLAIHYSPRDVNFFLIDYKGGGMSGLFEGLPHICGQISNLSGSYINRAMVSIKSENRRRQEIFREYKVNNINDYTRLVHQEKTSVYIPHIFIIIDEFAELKKEEPEFMKELISVAQVGRSLGIHLILATQKPSGTVDEKIWSNARFRVCLRVQDSQDSIEMLHKSDASKITQVGRGYLQVGNDEIYELFQSGWSGAIAENEELKKNKECADLIRLNGEADMEARPDKNSWEGKVLKKEQTQLEVVKEYIILIAKQYGYKSERSLWMDPLPDTIYLMEIEAKNKTKVCCRETEINFQTLEICVGIMDDPKFQRQPSFIINFLEDGHLFLCGMAATGKSTFLQTMVYSLVHRYDAERINLYMIDCSGGALLAFKEMPQVGEVVKRGDKEKIRRIFHYFITELEKRKNILEGISFEQYLKSQGEKYPALFLVIDDFSVFNMETEQYYEEQLVRIAKEGENAGIYIAVTASGISMTEFPVKLAENFKRVICLGLKDNFAYTEVVGTISIPVTPEKGKKGRGIAYYGESVLEFQTALCLETENDYERLTFIKQRSIQEKKNWKRNAAPEVKMIPSKPTWSVFLKSEEVEKMLLKEMKLPLGYYDSTADIFEINLNEIYCFLVTGHRKSGKKNFLKVLIEAAIKKKYYVCIIDIKGGLKSYKNIFEEQNGLHCYANEAEQIFLFFEELTVIFTTRNKKKKENSLVAGNFYENNIQTKELTKEEIVRESIEKKELEMTKTEEPIYIIVIDDMKTFLNMAYEGEYNMSAFLENIWEKGRGYQVYFIGGMDLGDQAELVGYKAFEKFCMSQQGIHFGGNVVDNRILDFEAIPYMEQMESLKSGIGILSGFKDRKEKNEKVVIPWVDSNDIC